MNEETARHFIFDLYMENDSAELTRAIVEHPDYCKITNSRGESLLHYAARGDNVNIARLVIHSGGDVNLPNCLGLTPLHEAARTCSKKMIQLLVQSGANLEAKDYEGWTPIMFASINRLCAQRDLVEFFHHLGAQLDLNTTVRVGATEYIAGVIAADANWLELVPFPGQLLADAVAVKNTELVRLFLTHGVDPNMPDNENITPIYHACNNKYTPAAIVKLLMEHGANPHQCVKGTTPLELLTKSGRTDIPEMARKSL